jgi:hypothetical protein
VIVRLLGEGQYRVPDELTGRLNELDDAIIRAVEAGDEQGLWAGLTALADAVRRSGTKLGDDELVPSDTIVPPEDLSLEEARDLLSGDGFVPGTVAGA